MPGAWEIMQTRKNRILMVTISNADMKVSLSWARSLGGIELPPESSILDVRGLPYHAARNQAIAQCVKGDFGWMFFLDSDTIPPPNIVTRLLASGRDLIGALYFQRFPPFKPSAFIVGRNEKGEIGTADLPPYNPGDIIPIDFLGTGATLISRRCIEEMFKVYPRPFDWGVDIAPVPDGKGGNLPTFSEDYMFSWRAKGLNYQPWLHTGIVCKHEFAAVVGPRGVEAQQ